MTQASEPYGGVIARCIENARRVVREEPEQALSERALHLAVLGTLESVFSGSGMTPDREWPDRVDELRRFVEQNR